MAEAPWYAPFAAWWAEAEAHEPRVPDAMQIATVDADGSPSLRTVLLKEHGPDGLVFYTHTTSRKGRALAADSRLAACLHWKSLERQVLAEGRVVPVTATQADAYWATRPRGSQLGAWASPQSEEIADRQVLLDGVDAAARRFDGQEVPRPAGWSGFRLVPERVELWQGHADRLHERRCWLREDGVWRQVLLAP
ncbi:MAG: pyridoxamine 5'-phosphate oxidase [Alphaproteobacteria bacterium]|nr:pyridoxamine 5'-phosphate oxidase [Alphaproteobacteria bacterium]